MLGHLPVALVGRRCQTAMIMKQPFNRILHGRMPFSGNVKRRAIDTTPKPDVIKIPSPVSTLTAPVKPEPQKKTLTIALVGRPNTGKSTLFNRLTSTDLAIVSAVAGTTRDRKEEKGYLAALPLIVMDTGGLDDRGSINTQIQEQVVQALTRADVVIFMLDAKVGVTSLDDHFAKWIRKTLGQIQKTEQEKYDAAGVNKKLSFGTSYLRKELILLANKTEGAHLSENVMDCVADAMSLGLGEPILMSASHGEGMAELATLLIEIAQKRGCEDGANLPDIVRTEPIKLEDRTIQVAVMGRPNVGKSSLVNAFVGEERCIVGDMPGLTRDAIHVEWTYKDRNFRLVDTAGLTRVRTDKSLLTATKEKRKMRLESKIGRNIRLSQRSGSSTYSAVELPGIALVDPESDPSQFSHQVSELSLVSAMNALKYAQVVLLVVENSQGTFSKLDLQIARKCMDEGRALVIAANKGDLAYFMGVGPRAYEEGVKAHCDAFMRELGDVPVIACVAIEKKGINRVLETLIRVHDSWSNRISTWILNKWLKDLLVTTPPPRVSGKKLAVKYIVQVKARPPTFALFCNTKELPGFFERFLRSRIQQDFKLDGVPIRMLIRKSKGSAVDLRLLKNASGKNKRGVGNGFSRVPGPRRKNNFEIKKFRARRDMMRRRNARMKASRKPKKTGGKLPAFRQNKH